MRVDDVEEALEDFTFAELAALRMVVRREVTRRWADWLEDPETLREVAPDWDPRLIGAMARECQEKAETLDPWNERRDAYRELADVLLVEALTKEQEAEEAP